MTIKKVALAAIALFALVLGVAPAHAAVAARTVTIRQIDTTQWPIVRVSVQVSGARVDARDINVRDGDRLVSDLAVKPLGESSTRLGTVLTIDVSGSMAAGGRIEAARAAANAFVERMLPNEQVAVVAFNDEPHLVSGFTNDRNSLRAAINGLQAHGETALWDAVGMAAGLLQAAPDLQPDIVVLSDGQDTTSDSSAANAQGAVVTAKAVTFTVGLGSVDASALQALAQASSGQFLPAPTADALRSVYGSVQDAIQAQYELSYKATGTEPRNVTVTAAGASAAGLATPGTLARGANTRPQSVAPAKPLPLLGGPFGEAFIAFMVLGAVGAVAWVILMVSTRPASQLDERLAPYAAENEDQHLIERAGVVQAETQLVKRAVDTATKLEAGRKLLAWLENKLEQANLPVRALEATFFYGIASLLGSALAIVLAGPMTAAALLAALALTPPAVLSYLARRRQKTFSRQLPDMLNLLAGTLRAGYSLLQGVEAVAQEIGDPMGEELRRVLAEARLGRPLEEALSDTAARMNSADFDWAVMAISIQREVGGNLAELLDTVAETMIARDRLRREVRSLTAEGRMSAIVIGVMPIGLGAFMWMMNRQYINVLFTDKAGRMALIGSTVLALFGFWWMKKTIEIEV